MSEHEVAGFKGFSPILQRRSEKLGKGGGWERRKSRRGSFTTRKYCYIYYSTIHENYTSLRALSFKIGIIYKTKT